MKKNNTISIVEDDIYQKYVNLDPTDCEMIHKYLAMLTDIVGLKIKDIIGKGNCIADGVGTNSLQCCLSLLACL